MNRRRETTHICTAGVYATAHEENQPIEPDVHLPALRRKKRVVHSVVAVDSAERDAFASQPLKLPKADTVID
jgi:hypothetical protein